MGGLGTRWAMGRALALSSVQRLAKVWGIWPAIWPQTGAYSRVQACACAAGMDHRPSATRALLKTRRRCVDFFMLGQGR